MPLTTSAVIPAAYLVRVREMLADGQRKLLGLTGPPGAGKSTVAQALRDAFPDVSQVVPMDGFHLAGSELHRLDRASRKGAPDTFDSAGFVALLGRLRAQGAEGIVYAPDFRRDLEEPVAGAIPVFPHTRLVLVEGNYLLLEEGAWAGVAPLLDDTWYIEVDEALRRQRLVQRHERFGRSPADAVAWMQQTDEPNARRIAGTRSRARVVFSW